MDQVYYNVSYRLYIGNSNWINLTPKMTADFIEIWKKGQPTKYKISPGLSLDILPNDVDCNSKNTDLPMLMRADLCYDNDDENEDEDENENNNNNKNNNNDNNNKKNENDQDKSQLKTLTERKDIAQQRLSRLVKNILESQGIVDAFPPTSSSDDDLPHVLNIQTHRHLGLIPAMAKLAKRISNLKLASPINNSNSNYHSSSVNQMESTSEHHDISINNTKNNSNNSKKSHNKKGKGKRRDRRILSKNGNKLNGKSNSIKKKIVNKKNQLITPSPYYNCSSTYANSLTTTEEVNNSNLTTSPTSIYMEPTLTTLNNVKHDNESSNNDLNELNSTTNNNSSFYWLPAYSNLNPPISYQRNHEPSYIMNNNNIKNKYQHQGTINKDNDSDIHEEISNSSTTTTHSIDSKVNDFFSPIDVEISASLDNLHHQKNNNHYFDNENKLNHGYHHHHRHQQQQNSNLDTFWYASDNHPHHSHQSEINYDNLLPSSTSPSTSSSLLYQQQQMNIYNLSEYSSHTYHNHRQINNNSNSNNVNHITYHPLTHSPNLSHYKDSNNYESSTLSYLFNSTNELINNTTGIHSSVKIKSPSRPCIESTVTF